MTVPAPHPAARVGFGCGPRAELMVSGDTAAQDAVIARALETGVTFFDTAPLYGAGESERQLGRALRAVGAPENVIVSTKLDVAVPHADAADAYASVTASLGRLRRDRVDLVLLHNRVVTGYAGVRPAHAPGPALTVDELLRPRSVLAGLVRCREAGLVGAIGLTGFGSEDDAVIGIIARSGVIDVLSVESNLLNQTAVAGRTARADDQQDYAGMASMACAANVTLLGLRPLAGGMLVDRPDPDRSSRTAVPVSRLRDICTEYGVTLSEAAWQFAVLPESAPVTLGGFRNQSDLDLAVSAATAGPDLELLSELTRELAATQHEVPVR